MRNLTKIFGLTIVLLVSSMFPGKILSKVSGEEPIILKGITGTPINNLYNQSVPTFIDLVYKKSNGRLKIEWTGGPEVIATFDQAEAVKKGTIDMLLHYPRAYFKSHIPVAEASALSQLTAWEERKSGAFELWAKIFREKANAEYIGRFHSNIKFCVYTNFKVEKLDDMKGKKFRVMPLYTPLFIALGASPVTIPPSDIHTGMERRVVDGYMWPELGIVSMGWHEVTKFVIYPSIFQIEPTTVINLDKFNKLPKDLQAVLKDSMENIELIATEQLLKVAQAEWEKMQKAGMRRIELPPADAKKFINIAYETTWNKIIKDDPIYGPQFKKLTSK